MRHKLESGKRLILKDIECREFIVERFKSYIESYNKSTCRRLEVEYNSNTSILSMIILLVNLQKYTALYTRKSV